MAKYIYPTGKYLTITQGFKSTHVGLDFGWNGGVIGGNHQPIVAIADGTVVSAVDGYWNTYPSSRIYGNYVIVSHGSGIYTMYAHLRRGTVAVKSGQRVTQGQRLGDMGNSGYSVSSSGKYNEEVGQHLHFELRVGGNSKAYAVNPLLYLECPKTVIISDKSIYRAQIKVIIGGMGTPVARNVTVDQIEVLINNLNARDNASINADRVGTMNKGIYNVSVEQMGGDIEWCEVEPDLWFAQNEGAWTRFLLKEIKPKLYNTTINGISEGDKNKVVALGREIGVPAIVTEV